MPTAAYCAERKEHCLRARDGLTERVSILERDFRGHQLRMAKITALSSSGGVTFAWLILELGKYLLAP
jgi:hypothetical protein